MHLPQSPTFRIPRNTILGTIVHPARRTGRTILSAGAIRLLARRWNGQGRFEDLFALLGFSLMVVAVAIGLPDLVINILPVFGVAVPRWLEFYGPHMYLGTAWYFVLMILAVRETEQLSWAKTSVLGFPGALVNGAVQVIFIR